MSTKGKRPLLSAHEKVEAIRRVHDGESKASVARDIGVPESTLRGWCKNEDKILYLSRQSTPETVDSEPDLKKTKYDYPVSSLTNAMNLNFSTSPTQSTTIISDSLNNSVENKVPGFDPKYNLLTTAKTSLAHQQSHEKRELSKRTLMERQRTRAELDRLSAELGLNRPEFGLLNVAGNKTDQAGINMSMLATSPLTNLNHLSGGTSHTANLGVSFQEIAAKVWNQVNQNAAVAAAAASLAQNSTLNNKQPKTDLNHQSMGLNLVQKDNQTPKKASHSSNNLPSLTNNTDDSTSTMWFWLRAQQEMLNLTQNQSKPLNQQQSPTAPALSNNSATNSNNHSPPTSNNSTGTNLSSPLSMSSQFNDLKNSSWFWKWYKQYYGFIPNLQALQQLNNLTNNISNPTGNSPLTMPPAPQANNVLAAAATSLPTLNNENNILLQQLTKDTSNQTSHDDHNSTKIEDFIPKSKCVSPPHKTEDISSTNNKNSIRVRAVLDNLLTNNNVMHNNRIENNQGEVKENEIEPALITSTEALECGQKFLKWLESCSDPAVTAMQVIQFRLLLNNIKTSAERKNNAQNSTNEKVNRRK